MTRPKISIIVPIFNVEKYLKQCLSSLQRQTLKEIEIICVEDKSTDKSLEILKSCQLFDDRIKIIQNSKNSGLSTSRNIGIENSQAPYVMFLDSDDYLAEDACEKLYKAITSKCSDVAICNVEVIYESEYGNKEADARYFKNPFNGSFLMTPGVVSKIMNVVAWNKIYKRSLLNKFHIRFPDGLVFESYPFWGAYSSVAKKVTFIPDRLYKYRRREGGIMAGASAQKTPFIDYVKSIELLYDWLIKNDLWTKFQWNFYRLFLFCVRSAYLYANSDEDREKIYSCVRKFLERADYDKELVGRLRHRGIELLKENKYNKLQKINSFLSVKRDFSSDQWYIFGIKLVQKNYGSSDTYSIFGIPLLKSTITIGYETLNLFGLIPIYIHFSDRFNFIGKSLSTINKFLFRLGFKKKFTNKKYIRVNLEPINFSGFSLDNSALLTELKSLKEFTYIPNPGNMGDCLIAKATFDFFDQNKLKYNTIDKGCSDNLVYGGGGIWVKDIYAHIYKPYLDIMKKAKRVVLLPCSIYECDDIVNILDERFTVFCRDSKTYKYLANLRTNAKLYLDHDMALRLQPSALKGMVEINYERYLKCISLAERLLKLGKIAYFFRQDKEKSAKYLSHIDLSSQFGSKSMNKLEVSFISMFMLSAIDSFDVIVTDRLHVAIAATLLNKEVYILDNFYGKLSGVYEQSLKGRSNVHLCSYLPEIDSFRNCSTTNLLSLIKQLKK